MNTAFTRLIGVDLPIVQAPMGGASCPELAAAVSNAGGLGMLALSWATEEAARRQIRSTRALTSRPFGVNLVLAFPQTARLAACLEEGVDLVSFFWGDPTPFVDQAHAAGALVAATVGSAREAARAAQAGVDIIVAQGWEAGGHVCGQVATLPLVSAVLRVLDGRPVLAAGGVADGRGLAAMLALGAAGVWVGTRFLGAPEAAIHPEYRTRLLAADETSTAYTRLFDVGWPDAPHRVLRNTTVEAWERAGGSPNGARPDEGQVLGASRSGPLVRYGAATPGPDAQGDIEALSLWAGQSVGGVHTVKPAGEIVREMARDATAALSLAQGQA